MPPKRRIIAIPKTPRAVGKPYEGIDRRGGTDRRTRERRANADNYTRSVILGRRKKSMGPVEIGELLGNPGWSNRRNRALGSRLAEAIYHEGKIPVSEHNPEGMVVQTTRRRMTTRRFGPDRRQPHNWEVLEVKETTIAEPLEKPKDNNANKKKHRGAHRPAVTEVFD